MIYNYIIQSDRLRMAAPQKGNTGNVNTYVCNFKFDGEWDGLTKFMAIKTDSQCIAPVLITDNQCLIPNEVLVSPCALLIGVYGTTGTASDYKRISTNWVGLRIDEGAYCEGTAPAEPTPDTWETYLAKVQALADRAEQAETGAITAETEAAKAEQEAKDAEKNAQDAETGAEAAAQSAQAYAGEADAYRAAANESAGEAWTSAQLAEEYKNAAVTASADAYQYSQDAEDAKTAVDTAKSEIDQQVAHIQSEVDRIEGLDVYTKPESDMRYLPKGTAAGYPLTVSDHLEGAGVINYWIQGNTKPENGSGKNLLYSTVTTLTSNGVTLTYDHGKITLNGSCTASSNFNLGNIGLRAGTYTLSANANKVPVSNNYSLIQLYDANNNQQINLTNSNALSSDTVTTSSDGTFLYRIRIETGTTYDNFVLQPQLESGTTATPYEPCSALIAVGDLVETGEQAGKYKIPVVCRGKNLFNMDEIPQKTGMTKSGTQITLDAETYAHVFSNQPLCNRLLPNTTYTISTVYTGSGIKGAATGSIRMVKPAGDSIAILPFDTTSCTNKYRTYTFTTPSNIAEYTNIYLYGSQNRGITIYDKIQIEIGELATTYEQYTAPQTADIYLDAPLQTGESISYTADNLPAITAPQSSAMTILVETAVQPSEINIQYYQDINKKLKELQNAMIAGGTANV